MTKKRYNIPRHQVENLYYRQGLTLEEVGERFDCSGCTILARMEEWGLPRRSLSEARKGINKFPISKDLLEQLYLEQGLSVWTIGDMLGCQAQTICNRLREYGIPSRSTGPVPVQILRQDVLSHWTPELAYVVGLVCSDGCLSKSVPYEVDFFSNDLELIETYQRLLGLDWPPFADCRGAKTCYKVRVNDPNYRHFLERVGLTPAKSKILQALNIPMPYFRDFFRGCFDGDGCWHIDRQKGHSYLAGSLASASPDFLAWVRDVVAKQSGLYGRIASDKVRYFGTMAVAMGHWMYYTANLPCLARKYKIWANYASDK